MIAAKRKELDVVKYCDITLICQQILKDKPIRIVAAFGHNDFEICHNLNNFSEVITGISKLHYFLPPVERYQGKRIHIQCI